MEYRAYRVHALNGIGLHHSSRHLLQMESLRGCWTLQVNLVATWHPLTNCLPGLQAHRTIGKDRLSLLSRWDTERAIAMSDVTTATQIELAW